MIGAVFGPCFVLRGARGELHGRYGALLCSVAEALAVFAGTPRGAAGGAICTAFAAAAAGVASLQRSTRMLRLGVSPTTQGALSRSPLLYVKFEAPHDHGTSRRLRYASETPWGLLAPDAGLGPAYVTRGPKRGTPSTHKLE